MNKINLNKKSLSLLMQDIKKFIESQSLPATPFKYQKGKNQKYMPLKKGYMDLTYEQSKELIDEQGIRDGLLIVNKNKYVVFDTDTKEAYGEFIKMVSAFGLDFDNLFRTKSYSHTIDKNLFFKNHFYFKIGSGGKYEKAFLKLFNSSRVNVIVNGLDVIIDKVAEHKKTIFEPNKAQYIPEEMAKYFIKKHFIDKKDSSKKEFSNNKISNGDEGKDEIKFILNNLPSKYYDEYIEWRNVGLILKSGGFSFELFDEFSKRSDKYDSKAVKTFWDNITINKNGLTTATLKYYLSNDNKEAYELYRNKFHKVLKYEEVKEKFEEEKFKVMHPLSYCYELDGDLIMCNKATFKDTFENVHYEKETKDKIKKINFVRKWMTDEKIRTYDRLDFLPCEEVPKGVYNTFKGFEAEKKEINKEFINSSIYTHIKKYICDGNEKAFEYLMMWLSRRVKRPAKLPGTAIVVQGQEGSGKSCLFDWIGKSIIGNQYFIDTQKIDNIFGKFNALAKNKIFVVLNEIQSSEGTKYKEDMKDFITAEIISIQNKGKDSYKQKHCAGYLFTTNNINSIRADAQDRRYTFYKMNNDIKNNETYFNRLFKDMNSGDYDRSFYEYLMALDSDKYNFTDNRPKSEYTKMINYSNTSPIKRYVLYLNSEQKLKEFMICKKFYDDFYEWLYEEGYEFKTNKQILGMQMRMDDLIIDTIRKKEKGKNIRYYKFNLNHINNIQGHFVDI